MGRQLLLVLGGNPSLPFHDALLSVVVLYGCHYRGHSQERG